MSRPTPVDWEAVRADFPVLSRQVHGRPLVYLDSANTSQKPRQVIEAVDDFYRLHNANISRAVHALGQEATDAYEGARAKLAAFVNARPADVVLTSGTTQAINLVAYSHALPTVKPGEAILLTQMEHHANIVPWQLVAERGGSTIKVAPVTPDGELDLDALWSLMTPEVKLLAFTHVSNVLGTVNPVADICREARRRGIVTLVDGSQALPHRPVDIPALGCDFYAFTGHKMLGPTGTGALWARREHLQSMPPFLGGGEMIREVRFEGTTYNDPPHKFEAGTPKQAISGCAQWWPERTAMPSRSSSVARSCACAPSTRKLRTAALSRARPTRRRPGTPSSAAVAWRSSACSRASMASMPIADR